MYIFENINSIYYSILFFTNHYKPFYLPVLSIISTWFTLKTRWFCRTAITGPENRQLESVILWVFFIEI